MNIKKEIEKLKKHISKLENEINQTKKDWLQFDFGGKAYELSGDLGTHDWYRARKLCKELGGNLPSRWLLVAIHDEPELKEVEKTFLGGNFWSSTEGSETYARFVYFTDGHTATSNKTNYNSVRCVREVVRGK